MRRREISMVAVAIVLWAVRVWAGAVPHVVREGETPESLAASFYGDRGLAVFIREWNGLGAAGRLVVGKRVEIPSATAWKVRRGDSLEAIARRQLGDGRRAFYLAQVNGLRLSDTLQVGGRLWLPFHLSYRAQAPESLAAIAKKFYRDEGQGKLLADYNFRSSMVLAGGERLVVPVPHVRVSAAARARDGGAEVVAATEVGTTGGVTVREEARAAVPSAAVVPSAAGATGGGATGGVIERLRAAERAFRDGNYEEMQGILGALAREPLSRPQEMAVHKLLGFFYVVVGAEDDALAEFGRALALDPGLSLDPLSVSPKLREVFERARAAR